MKKIKLDIFIFLLMFVFIPINAFAASTMELIPVGTNANVNTDLFEYNFVFNTTDVTFSSIKNNTTNKVPVSIDILLFDDDKINIGYLTYCSDRDISSDYAGFKLGPSASTNFYIKVVSKYLVEGKSGNDIKYIAVQDENKYCRIGGYDKYKGLTIDEISGGRVSAENNENVQLTQIKSFLKNNFFQIILIVGFIVFGFIFILGLFINTLHRKIYNHGSILSFIPIANMYLCVKLAFGSTVGLVYIIAFVGSALLSSVLPVLSSLVGLLGLAAFIVVIYKLLSKNYSLFIGTDKSKDNNITMKQEKSVKSEEVKVEVPVTPTVEEVIAENKEEALDLSYGTSSSDVTNNNVAINTNNETNSSNNNSAFDDMFDFNGNVDNSINTDTNNNKFINTDIDSNNTESLNDNKNKEGESDLSKFFK